MIYEWPHIISNPVILAELREIVDSNDWPRIVIFWNEKGIGKTRLCGTCQHELIHIKAKLEEYERRSANPVSDGNQE